MNLKKLSMSQLSAKGDEVSWVKNVVVWAGGRISTVLVHAAMCVACVEIAHD